MKPLLLIIVLNCWATNNFGQSIADSSTLNRQLLTLEYRLWSAHCKDTTLQLLYQKARLLKQAGSYEQSYRELCRIKSEDAREEELNYEKALTLFLRGDYNGSYHHLTNIPDSLRYKSRHTLRLWMLTLTELNRWNECKQMLSSLVLSDTTFREDLTLLPTEVKHKSPEKAVRLSLVLPGLGQMYTGHWGKGSTSLILHAGLILFAGEACLNAYYLSGTMGGLYPLIRFYTGGQTLSYQLALQYNDLQDLKTKKQYQSAINKALFTTQNHTKVTNP